MNLKEFCVVYLDRYDNKISTWVFAETKANAIEIVKSSNYVYRVLYATEC